jgi:outer membrane lipoprotein-sorting protein
MWTRNCCGGFVRRIPVFFGLGVAFAAAAFAQKAVSTPAPSPPAAPPASGVSETVSAALARAVALYSDGAGHSSPFVQIYTPAGFATTRRESGTVSLQAPQRVRFDYDPLREAPSDNTALPHARPDKKVFTYDAGEGRFFSPEDKQLTVRRLSEDEKARLPIVFLTQPADLGRQYEITVEPGESAPARLLLKPRVARPDLAWLRLAIERDGSVRELSYQDPTGNKTEFRFEAWQRGKARPAADFRITGPPGTRIVEN